MMTKTAATVDAWLSHDCDTMYSVSICDEDGNEIRCVGGSDDEDEAFELAREYADDMGIPARLLPRESDEVTRTYTPDDDSSEHNEKRS